MAVGRVLDEAEQKRWLEWLAERSDGDGVAGFDAVGWPAETWVLHSIYEDPESSSNATWDDMRRARLAAGVENPLIIGSVNLDDRTTVIGGSLGMGGRSGDERSRLTWHDLAARLEINLGDNQWPPSFKWFPYRSWPARLDPPHEGSLDYESLLALVDVLVTNTPSTGSARCIAYYCPLANDAGFDRTWMREVEVGEVPSLVEQTSGLFGSPSNWWSNAGAWMIYTDWDLWATKVSGPSALIASIESDPRLECTRWNRDPIR